jgi:hypothetical protein
MWDTKDTARSATTTLAFVLFGLKCGNVFGKEKNYGAFHGIKRTRYILTLKAAT